MSGGGTRTPGGGGGRKDMDHTGTRPEAYGKDDSRKWGERTNTPGCKTIAAIPGSGPGSLRMHPGEWERECRKGECRREHGLSDGMRARGRRLVD